MAIPTRREPSTWEWCLKQGKRSSEVLSTLLCFVVDLFVSLVLRIVTSEGLTPLS